MFDRGNIYEIHVFQLPPVLLHTTPPAVTSSERLAVFTDAIRRLEGYSSRISGELAAEYEALNLQDLTALTVLGLHGPSRMGALAEHLAIAQSTLTPIVDRLEDHGLARRRRSEADRRVWLVELTDAGEQIVADMDDLYRQVAASMLEPLSDEEQETFVKLFMKVTDALSEPE